MFQHRDLSFQILHKGHMCLLQHPWKTCFHSQVQWCHQALLWRQTRPAMFVKNVLRKSQESELFLLATKTSI